MRSITASLLALLVPAICVPVSAGDIISHRAGIGLQYDAVSGDTDNGSGVYGYYEIDLPDPVSIMLEVSYVTGDFDVASGAGSYDSLAIGGAFILRHELKNWTPYIGFGGANHINHFDQVNYDNKLSMFFLAGGRVRFTDRLGADISLRYRTLRVNSDDTTVEPNPLDMDAMVLRAGLVYEL